MLTHLIASNMMPRLIAVEIVILATQAVLYLGCELFQYDHRNVKRDIDDRIPLIPAFTIVYVTWFPLIALFPIVLYFLSPLEYTVYQVSIIISALLSTIIYVLFPTTFERPALASGGGSFWERLLGVIYVCSFRGSNCSPSLHCIQSFIIMLSACCCPNFGGISEIMILCLCVAIVVSTLLTKQHVLMDAVTALPAAVLMFAASRIIVGYFGYTQLLSCIGLL